jgi:hypothetical protein
MAAAGALPLDPSSLDAVVATALAPAESPAERRRRRNREALRSYRRRMTALYAELGAMIPALPTTRARVSDFISSLSPPHRSCGGDGSWRKTRAFNLPVTCPSMAAAVVVRSGWAGRRSWSRRRRA